MRSTCFSTKLFMMIIGERPAYESPITATWGPVLSRTVETDDPCRPASSVSVRSTALRYSELASGEERTGTEPQNQTSRPITLGTACCNAFQPEKPESLSSSGLDASRVTLEYIWPLCRLGLLKLLILVFLEKSGKQYI